MELKLLKFGLSICLAILFSLSMLATATADHTAPPKDKETGEVAIIGGSVSRSAFTYAVVNREPRNRVREMPNDKHHIYYFTELKGMAGQKVTHRWFRNGKKVDEVKFRVGASRWRIWSSKTLLTEWTGDWEVQVVNDYNQVVHSDKFKYVAADQ